MGYTHYWEVTEEIPPSTWRKMVEDFRRAVPELEKYGARLAGPNGKGMPVFTKEKVAFNGPVNCCHKKMELHIPWPSEDAYGVFEKGVSGTWFGGSLVGSRTCDGDCSYETFEFGRRPVKFGFCKTAFRPYDLAVNVFLIIAKHYNPKTVFVSSDGTLHHWRDGMLITGYLFDYGEDFRLEILPHYLKSQREEQEGIQGGLFR